MSHDIDGAWIGDSVIGNLTLDEATENDAEMVKDVIKNARRYGFTTAETAIAFIGSCLRSTFDYLGVKNVLKMDSRMLGRIEINKKIHIEKREHYNGTDVWRNGIYIYQKDILVSFISDIFAEKRNIFRYVQPPLLSVITNVKVK